MSSLGIFFGPKSIGIIETNGKKIVNNIQIDRISTLGSSVESMEKVPDEVKIVAFIKDTIRKYKITATEAAISLSGMDLIVRSFDMPLLSAEELITSIGFEAKKYVPFKTEDLISDYQVRQDKVSRKNMVVFVGIKKDVLNKYFNIVRQAGLTPIGVEYSAFSVLRTGKTLNLGSKTPMAVITVGAKEEGEANFTVFDKDFPLLTRDINLSSSAAQAAETPAAAGTAPAAAAEPQDTGMALEKLKTELRISFDFYNRKFSGKQLASVCVFAEESMRGELEGFAREMGISLQWMEAPKIPGYAGNFSMGAMASYGASLFKTLKLPITINLAAPKVVAAKKLEAKVDVPGLLSGFTVDPKVVILGLVICGATAGLGYYNTLPVEKAVRDTIAKRPPVMSVNPDAPYSELDSKSKEYWAKIKAFDAVVKSQMLVTPALTVIPKLIPEGMWLTDFHYSAEDRIVTLSLNGAVYMADSEKEMTLVNDFVLSLKQDPKFAKMFPNIKITSVNQTTILNAKATVFSIYCGSAKESD